MTNLPIFFTMFSILGASAVSNGVVADGAVARKESARKEKDAVEVSPRGSVDRRSTVFHMARRQRALDLDVVLQPRNTNRQLPDQAINAEDTLAPSEPVNEIVPSSSFPSSSAEFVDTLAPTALVDGSAPLDTLAPTELAPTALEGEIAPVDTSAPSSEPTTLVDESVESQPVPASGEHPAGPFEIAILGDARQATGCSSATHSQLIGTISFNEYTRLFKWSYTYGSNAPFFNDGLLLNGTKETAAKFHGPAAAGESAEIILDVSGSPMEGQRNEGNMTLTAKQATYLKRGLWYLNIESAACPDGELRSQLPMHVKFKGDVGQSFGCNKDSQAEIHGTAAYDEVRKYFQWRYTYGDNPPAFDNGMLFQNGTETAAHFRAAGQGEVGPEQVNAAGVGGEREGWMQGLDEVQIKDVQSGKWYLSISSTSCPNGELRAQIVGLDAAVRPITTTTTTTTTTSPMEVAITGDMKQAVNCNVLSQSRLLGTVAYNEFTRVLAWNYTYGNNPPFFDNQMLMKGKNKILCQFHGPAPPGKIGALQLEVTPLSTQTDTQHIGSAILSAEQASDMKRGLWYLSIQSETCPDGEIRAQLPLQIALGGDVTKAIGCDLENDMSQIRGAVAFDEVSQNFQWQFTYGNNYWSFNNGELHNEGTETTSFFKGPAPSGENEEVMVNVSRLTFDHPNAGFKKLTAGQGADLQKGLWYLSIGSTSCPDGELRGQIFGLVPSSSTVPEVCSATPWLTTVAEALQATNLFEPLSEPGPFTLFAPTNSAFTELLTMLKITKAQLLAFKKLPDILLYHALDGVMRSSTLVNITHPWVTTKMGSTAFISTRAPEIPATSDGQADCASCAQEFDENGGCEAMINDQDVAVLIPVGCEACAADSRRHCESQAVFGAEGALLQGTHAASTSAGHKILIDDAVITHPDIPAINGMIHVIDKVLMPPNVYELATKVPTLTTLVTSLKHTPLVTTLSSPGPFTVFAPTNTAITNIVAELKMTMEDFLAGKDLKDILAYHVVDGTLFSNCLTEQEELVTKLGATAIVTSSTGDDGVVALRINDATITEDDLVASNGVVHIIDKVLIPPNIMQLSQKTPTLSTLVNALKSVGLELPLSKHGSYTVIAPTNAAFANAFDNPAETLEALEVARRSDLEAMLKAHVFKGRWTIEELSDGAQLENLDGIGAVVAVKDGLVSIDGAQIGSADIIASNGVLHMVDHLSDLAVGILARTTTTAPGLAETTMIPVDEEGDYIVEAEAITPGPTLTIPETSAPTSLEEPTTTVATAVTTTILADQHVGAAGAEPSKSPAAGLHQFLSAWAVMLAVALACI
jgi:uncharacterized surface protein with fasciclin (FAS1) repeats